MYEKIEFPILPDRPYFYTNFVSTLDGKVDVPTRHSEYWPIGSSEDYRTLINLRVASDALIHGSRTAMMHRSVDSLSKEEFKDARRSCGKNSDLLYIVVSNNPDDTLKKQISNTEVNSVIMSGEDLPALARELKQKGVDAALVEGGPHIAASFFSANLIDEIFLTLAPKVFGGGGLATLTMTEGELLDPKKIREWQLVSAQPIQNEIFLRYRLPIRGPKE